MPDGLVNVSTANGEKTLTQNISGSVPGYETRVVPVAHPFLEDTSAEILAEAAARRHQAVVAAVCLRKSADNSSGNQSTVRQHRQHHLHGSSAPTNRPSQQTALAQCRSEGAHNVGLLTKLNGGGANPTPGQQQPPRTHSQRRPPTGACFPAPSQLEVNHREGEPPTLRQSRKCWLSVSMVAALFGRYITQTSRQRSEA